MMRAKCSYSFTGPPVPAPGQQAAPIERIGQQIIRTDLRQGTHSLHDLRRGVGAILTAAASRQAQLVWGAFNPFCAK